MNASSSVKLDPYAFVTVEIPLKDAEELLVAMDGLGNGGPPGSTMATALAFRKLLDLEVKQLNMDVRRIESARYRPDADDK